MITKPEFALLMMELRGRYPHMAKLPLGEWRVMLEQYHAAMCQFSHGALVKVFAKVFDSNPQFFPAAPAIIPLARLAEQGLAMPRLKSGPSIQTTSLGDDHPAEKIARALEREAGDDRTDHSTARLAAARIGEALELVGAEGFSKLITGLGPAPNEDDFCPECGLLKLNHGLFGDCAQRFESKFETEDPPLPDDEHAQ